MIYLEGLMTLFFMQEVKVVDNFLTQEEFSDIWDYIRNVFWTKQNSFKGSESDFLFSDLSKIEYFNSYLLEE